MPHRFLATLLFLLVLGACQTDDGSVSPGAELNPVLAGDWDALVAVIDERPYVLKGEESVRFIGTERGKWSNTIHLKTGSGRPLAEEIADKVIASLGRRGISAAALPVKKGTPVDPVLAEFRAAGGERFLIVRVREWQANSYTRITIRWNIEATVYDRSGTFIARRQTQGSEAVGSTSFDGGDTGGQRALEQKLMRVLDHPAITAALG